MKDQTEKARLFAELHLKGGPLVLFNVWDAGTAKAVAETGARAIATGSYAVALANGFEDGEKVPLELACANVQRIAASVDLPVSMDFESGYARGGEELAANIAKVVAAGAVGINFEDQFIGGEGIYCVEEQAARIRTVREAATIPLFINARSDVFLSRDASEHTEDRLTEAIERAHAYAEAGASGFFAPALVNPDFIGRLCEASPIPVNILVWPGVPSTAELAALGVARVSYGGGSYRIAMEAFKEAAANALAEARSASAPATGRP